LCVKAAWHGDRLLSGGADRTVRLWDLAGSGGKCLNSLSGHFGWVTSVQYWGPNTIISASTDRSVALWDVRVRNSPLFILRHHYAPVSDLLVGSRSDPVMVSAAVDGSVAAWDFRLLTGVSNESPVIADRSARQCKVVRNPAGTLYTHKFTRQQHTLGPVHLGKGVSRQRKTALCLGSDAIIREWDYQNGDIVNEHVTGHCDTISSFVTLGGDKVLDTQLESTGPDTATSTITASWDGTVRMRSLLARK
jgi:WD40 repeat protein